MRFSRENLLSPVERAENPSLSPATPRIWDREIMNSAELASRWNVPESWIRDQVRSRSEDPIPCVRLGRYVRFEWGSEALNKWFSRRRIPNVEGVVRPSTKGGDK